VEVVPATTICILNFAHQPAKLSRMN